MNLKNVRKFYIIVILTIQVCQYAQSQPIIDIENVTYVDYPTNDAVIYRTYPYNPFHIFPGMAIGLFAKPVQFPYMAVIHQLLGYPHVKKCAGTNLANRWVLTAGNCVAGGPRRFFVAFGITDKSGIGYDRLYGPEFSMISTEAVLHPQYQRHLNDIALLRMPSDIIITVTTTQTISLPNRTFEGDVLANRNANVIGWKQDEFTNLGTKKLKNATLPIIENYECEQYRRITDKHICTTPALTRSACVGDNGGPLIIKEKLWDTQVSIVSYGDASCPSDRPVVYTRVSQFTNWIFNIIYLFSIIHVLSEKVLDF